MLHRSNELQWQRGSEHRVRMSALASGGESGCIKERWLEVAAQRASSSVSCCSVRDMLTAHSALPDVCCDSALSDRHCCMEHIQR